MGSQHCREERKDEGMNPIADPKIVIRIKCNSYWKGFSLRPKIFWPSLKMDVARSTVNVQKGK